MSQRKVYFTGPYGAAPFGLSVVVPAIAGPFNLGTQVVRAGITVDRETAAVSVTSPVVPQQRDGIPIRVRDVRITVNRPGFLPNPTRCTAESVETTVGSEPTAGSRETRQVARSQTPFAARGCSRLAFTPSLWLSAGGRSSRIDGDKVHLSLR